MPPILSAEAEGWIAAFQLVVVAMTLTATLMAAVATIVRKSTAASAFVRRRIDAVRAWMVSWVREAIGDVTLRLEAIEAAQEEQRENLRAIAPLPGQVEGLRGLMLERDRIVDHRLRLVERHLGLAHPYADADAGQQSHARGGDVSSG